MSVRDFLLLVFVCLVWAANNVISKVIISHYGVPPLFFAAARFAVVSLAVAPWLWPPPGKIWKLVVVGLLMGGGNFALLFVGLQTASPSGSAIVGQMGVPITTILSMIFLGERMRWRRGIGIALTLAGGLLVIWNPAGLSLSVGLLFIAAAALAGSVGAVMMKQMEGVRPLQFQAWVAVSSVAPLMVLSPLLEHGQVAAVSHALWPFIGAVLFSGLITSVIGHTTYYALIQRYDAGLLQPLTLLTPLFTIALGILITHDQFGGRMALGALIALLGVLIIILQPARLAAMLRLGQTRAP